MSKTKEQEKLNEELRDFAEDQEQASDGSAEESTNEKGADGELDLDSDRKDITENESNVISELRNKYLRLMAEFDNYKKRSARERLELIGSAAKDTMSALLPILDDFDRAHASTQTDDSKEVFSEGVQLVYNKLYRTLEQRGLKAMDTQQAVFDPDLHEAVTEIEAGADMKGKVVDTIEKGYMLNDRIIRHAKVVVGK